MTVNISRAKVGEMIYQSALYVIDQERRRTLEDIVRRFRDGSINQTDALDLGQMSGFTRGQTMFALTE